MIITRDILKALKTARAIVIRENNTIDLFHETKGAIRESVTTIDHNETNSIFNGTWHTALYPNQRTEQNSIFDVIRAGDKLAFYTEDWSSDLLRDNGLCELHLKAQIIRYKRDNKTISKILEFTFDTRTTKREYAIKDKLIAA